MGFRHPFTKLRPCLLAILAALLALLSCGDKAENSAISLGSPTPDPQVIPVPAEYVSLVGKWVRPDGGYVIEIGKVEGSGAAEARYYNPSPINVYRARVLSDGGKTKFFLELRDVNYPGSTYSLEYDPATDQLFGEYFQAALGQTFDVTFVRLKPDN